MTEYRKWIAVLPCLAYLLAIGIWPLLYEIYLSFHSLELTVSSELTFIGPENYLRLLQDSRFLSSLWITLVFVIAAVGLELLIGMGLALIAGGARGQRAFRLIFTVPMMLTPVGVGFVWKALFDSNVGSVNHFLSLLLGYRVKIGWYADPGLALLTLALIDVWEWTPFMMLSLWAAIQSLPKEPQEAALVDGASRLQILRYVSLPALYPIIIALVLLRSAEAFKVFDLIYVLTKGGPGTATESTTAYAQILGFRTMSLGYAATVALALLIILILTFILITKVLRRVR